LLKFDRHDLAKVRVNFEAIANYPIDDLKAIGCWNCLAIAFEFVALLADNRVILSETN
jgi:hypothetical protein